MFLPVTKSTPVIENVNNFQLYSNDFLFEIEAAK